MKKSLSWILYLFILFIVFISLFSAFRYVLFQLNIDVNSSIGAEQYHRALWLGVSYDLMVVSYLIAPPALVFIFSMFFNYRSLWLKRAITLYFSIVLFIVLLSCCADIPFYEYCSSRLSTAILMWTDTPGTMMKFVFENPTYYPFLLALFILLVLGVIVLLFLQKKIMYGSGKEEKNNLLIKIGSATMVLLILLVGIRGGWRVRPIGIKDAFVSNHPFINLLPLNPLHSFFDSMEKINLDYLEEEVAINNARRFLNIKEPYDFKDKEAGSPIARRITFADSSIKPNIVLILMESMSAEMTALSSSKKSFTPALDSLAKNSISFSDFYTCGIHTCNGIYGTLYSLPSVPGEHPLSNIYAVNEKFTGLPFVLKQNGYSTSFFCTHFEEFDNMGFFLRNNSFENFFSRKDYPNDVEEVSFGVTDEALYDFAFHKLSDLSKLNKPFFTTLLTISTHEPPVLPKKTIFKPKSSIPFEQVYEYADWALGNFMKRCSKELWYNNTIFVFVADHGCNMQSPYEIPLSYHHSPFIIHAPRLIKEPKQIDALAMQPDVFPTLMNLLKIPYTNNTMGIDLFKEQRPFVFFCKDYLAGCLDKKHLLIVQKFGEESLYEYSANNTENIAEKDRSMVDSMKTYTYSMFQTAQWMLEKRMLSDPIAK